MVRVRWPRCADHLALMDRECPSGAGRRRAMGLVRKGSASGIHDILGDEDHSATWISKWPEPKMVSRPADDIKIHEHHARYEGSFGSGEERSPHILDEINKVSQARENMSEWAPTNHHPEDDRRKSACHRQGRRVIRQITEETGTSFDIENDGTVKIASYRCRGRERSVASNSSRGYRSGRVSRAKVARLMDFGAFVTILPAATAWCTSPDFRRAVERSAIS